jgi:hypothetical protein
LQCALAKGKQLAMGREKQFAIGSSQFANGELWQFTMCFGKGKQFAIGSLQ